MAQATCSPGCWSVAVDRIAERLEQIGETLDHLSHGIFHHPAAVARRAGRRLPIGKRTHRLEAVIEDLGTQHELASKLRESVQSLIRLTTFSIEHADDGLRRRLQASRPISVRWPSTTRRSPATWSSCSTPPSA